MKTDGMMSLACYLCVIAIFVFDLMTPAELDLPVLYVAYVLLSLGHSRTYFSYGLAVLATVFTMLALWFFRHSSIHWTIVLLNRGITLAIMWTVAYFVVERKRLAALRQVALQERDIAKKEIQELVSLLPMCAWCKKIRDDAGYWEGIESYFVRHTPDITHGICPSCSDRLEHQIKGMTCETSNTATTPGRT